MPVLSTPAGKLEAARVLDGAFLLLLGLCALLPWLFLGSSSFWFDELASTYSIASNQSWEVFWERWQQDIQAPLYFILLRLWSQVLGIEPETLRAFSAFCGNASLLIALTFGRRLLTRSGTLFLGLMFGISHAYLTYALEARPYAMLLPLSLLAALLLVKMARAAGDGGWGLADLTLLSLLALCGGLTHYYALPVFGAGLIYLLLLGPSKMRRLQTLLAGLATLLPVSGIVLFHMEGTLIDPQATHFGQANWESVLGNLQIFLLKTAGGHLGAMMLTLLTAFLAVPLFLKRERLLDAGRDLAPLLFTAALSVAVLVAVNFLIAPSFVNRYLTPLHPFVFVALALLFDRALSLGPGIALNLRLAVLMLTLACLPALAFLAASSKTEWRDSAQALAALPECHGADIAIVGFDNRNAGGPRARAGELYREDLAHQIYGYYLPRQADLSLHPIAPGELDGALARHLANTAGSSCPVALWSVHMLAPRTLETLAAAQNLSLRAFPHATRGLWTPPWIFGATSETSGAFFLLRR